MWFVRAVALDLDGTLAVGDRVHLGALAAIDAIRGERAVVLVTGRIGEEMGGVFPGLAGHFDAVVTENGAVVRTAGRERPLCQPVDLAVDKLLADRGVGFRRGRVLVAVDGRDAATGQDVITELGLDCQVVRNRAAAMILPAGVTKGTGLGCALDQLGLSAHNAIAVGDAENDLTLLQAAEIGVAVGNAVPSLAEHADVVLDRPDGAGVAELLTGPLLTGHQRLCPQRRWIQIGQFDDEWPAVVPGSQASLLITGDTGAGKSYLAGLLAERWMDAGYSILVIDREGDHLGLAERPGVHLVDAAAHLPSPSDLLALARPNRASLILDLAGLTAEEKLDYTRRLPDAISAERARHGTPHWVIHDEAHQGLWADDPEMAGRILAEPGTCLVTWQPDSLPDVLRRSAGITVTVMRPSSPGPAALATLRASLQPAGENARLFRVGERVSRHVRHRHKYATTPLPTHRRFYFHQPNGEAHSAATLEEFSQYLRHCDLATLDYHLSRGDFSRWIIHTLTDPDLGAGLATIERDLTTQRAGQLEQARHHIVEAIERRYLR